MLLRNRFTVVCLALIMSVISIGRSQAQTSVSFQVFYDELSPYGNWVSYPDYGYVWVPYANTGFRPYATGGHWVYTEDGWAWVSDYRWGWAPFHYGNWFYDDSYGWMWAPGYEWSPAWVTWGEYQGNYCWAPIGPRVDIGVSFSTYRPPYQYWNFCPRDRITSTRISNYYVNSYRNTTVINNITVINNVNRGGGGRPAYVRGPEARNVERFTHQSLRPVAIQTASRPGASRVEGGRLAIYRPNVQNNNSGARPAAVRDMHTLQPHNRTAPAPRPQQPGQQPPGQRPGQAQQQRPGQQPGQPHQPQPGQQPGRQPGRPVQQQPRPQQPSPQQPARPAPEQPRPVPQQPRPAPQQQHPSPQQPHQSPPQQHPTPQQPRPAPQQPRPAPQQPRPAPQQRPMNPPPQQQHPQPQAPRPQPQAPRPAPAPRPATPPPHQEPPHEHHR